MKNITQHIILTTTLLNIIEIIASLHYPRLHYQLISPLSLFVPLISIELIAILFKGKNFLHTTTPKISLFLILNSFILDNISITTKTHNPLITHMILCGAFYPLSIALFVPKMTEQNLYGQRNTIKTAFWSLFIKNQEHIPYKKHIDTSNEALYFTQKQ